MAIDTVVRKHPFVPKQRIRCGWCGLSKKLHTRAMGHVWQDRRPNEHSIRERAEFLAHELHHDVWASEAEVADAIEIEIRRFLV